MGIRTQGTPTEGGSTNMDPFERYTHSFIIRIWREETSATSGVATWRGHMTHIPGGERRYVTRLSDITTFITPYLMEMGVKAARSRRFWRWWERWKVD